MAGKTPRGLGEGEGMSNRTAETGVKYRISCSDCGHQWWDTNPWPGSCQKCLKKFQWSVVELDRPATPPVKEARE